MVVDNLLSVQYSESMLRSIDDLNDGGNGKTQKSIDAFESDLSKEENNITEAGEKELVSSLRDKFNRYKSASDPGMKPRMAVNVLIQRHLISAIRSDLLNISQLNMQAILRKNEKVSASVNSFYVKISIIASIFFLVSFSFIFNFPKYIADPIRDFTNSIREIGKQNYKLRLHHNSNDEFGELANAFNDMAEQLEGYTLNSKAKSPKNAKPKSVTISKNKSYTKRK
jgi:methyl-accepting chemotaxis protein